MSFSRRKFLTLAGATTVGTVAASPLQMLYARVANGQPVISEGYGPLIPDPNGLLDLPRGFRYNAFSRTGDRMSDGNPVPGDHDGMAAFPGPDNTTILVRNHELSPDESPRAQAPPGQTYDPAAAGGTTTLIVGPDRRLIRDFVSLAGTTRNCAGGPTPWGSWISCEETFNEDLGTPGFIRHGYNFEVPSNATGAVTPVPLREMGRFNHEAIAVDPNTGIVYETEDRANGLFYRFIPNQKGNFRAGGQLQALKIPGVPTTQAGIPVGQTFSNIEWVTIQEPDPAADTVRLEGAGKGATTFSRGEGCWYGNGFIYFTCTSGGDVGEGQIWRYEPQGNSLTLLAEPNNPEILDNPDNITVSPFDDLFLCEDGNGRDLVRGVTPDGKLYPFARNALNENELAGVCFSTSPLTMFVNIQDPGITFAIWGPWDHRKG